MALPRPLRSEQTLPAATADETWYVHLITTDTVGNAREQVFGPIVRTATPTPLVSLGMTSTLAADANGDGKLTPGDTLEWVITLRNMGSAELSGWTVTDRSVPALALTRDGVRSSAGDVAVDGQTVTVSGDALPAGNSVEIVVQTLLDAEETGIAILSNQAWVSAENYAPTRSDDPSTAVFGDATEWMLEPLEPEETPNLSWIYLPLIDR